MNQTRSVHPESPISLDAGVEALASVRAGAASPLVSVIVPVYNGERTIERTLRSVIAQTYSNLEVIVVDDGSTDQTRAIVRKYSAIDARVRLVQQENLGVAAARNAGLRASRSDVVAPIDADDLWHPTRIAKHMQLMTASGGGLDVVYSPSRWVDTEDQVLETPASYGCAGWVLLQLIYCNFVGNGSALLFRKAAAVAVGGYDVRLREHGLEGCEDYLFQLALARHYRFGLVPEYLVGYRVRGERMSMHAARMALSMAYVRSWIRQVHPDLPTDPFELIRLRNSPIRIEKLLRVSRLPSKYRLFGALLFSRRIKLKLMNTLQRCADASLPQQRSRSFLDYDPREGATTPVPLHDVCALNYLARLQANLTACVLARPLASDAEAGTVLPLGGRAPSSENPGPMPYATATRLSGHAERRR